MSARWRRLARGGAIDRARPLSFTLDGRRLQALAGDTLASALLVNGIDIVARSFKYHRPRGVLAAGVEEPNALLTLEESGQVTPNVLATVTPVSEGMVLRRQNAWPSAEFDWRAVHALAAPLLSAGFYYKTFMGPSRGSWHFYERFIRRAAGLGTAVHQRDQDHYGIRHRHVDVLVIGAGPAGQCAALAAARAGARTLLVEQSEALGATLAYAIDPALAAWQSTVERRLGAQSELEVRTRAMAVGVYDGNAVVIVERRAADAPRSAPRETVHIVQAGAIVFATGALERPLLFANNDRPGIVLASALRDYLCRQALVPSGSVVVATTHDSAWFVARDLASQGASVTLLDERAQVDAALPAMLREVGVRVELATQVVRAPGQRLTAIETQTGPDMRRRTIACDVLGVCGGWAPAVHLTTHTGSRPAFDERIDALVPGALEPRQFAAGALVGTFALAAAVDEGRRAGESAARSLGRMPAEVPDVPPTPDERCTGRRPRPPVRADHVFIDWQNDVTLADLRQSRQEGMAAPEYLKRYTTLGMGTDQGKTSHVNALNVLAAEQGSATGLQATTFRPPYAPVSVGALAGRDIGRHFRPTRRSPLHDWHVQNGAVMTQAGPWLRPWYYQWAGQTPQRAYVEEMSLVRTSCGLSDVSSLGKIDLAGPDVGELLNRLYVNEFANLPVGKARYGVMLNDDATVLDDGTCMRLGPERYLLTTTTAQAGDVMSRIEFLLQTAWSDLRVIATSVTDQWAAMSLAGPRSREVLAAALATTDVSPGALVHMGCRECELDGHIVRVARLSFSGELAYELYTPASHGIALWERLLAAGQSAGVRPYGLEALASLRIEKGHVAGLELDRRTTLEDLGLARMARPAKPFVGRELRDRPQLRSPQRWGLVGLEALEGAQLRGGAILFAKDDPVAGHGRGYVTSVTWSTVLGKYIALGLYQGGLAHEGEEIVCAYPLRNEQVRARIVSPVFIDPKGERLHG